MLLASTFSRTATTLMRRQVQTDRRTLLIGPDGTRAWIENLLGIWD